MSCSPTQDFQHREGLKFDIQDWSNDERLERPFLVNGEINENLNANEDLLYFPAELFRNTQIDNVYFEDMVSEEVKYIDGTKPRYQVHFSHPINVSDELPYTLRDDEAAMKITTNGIERVILIKDIRIPVDN